MQKLASNAISKTPVIDPVAGYRPQSKGGVERMVAVVKPSFWSVWLDLELEVTRSQSAEAETRLPLGGLLWADGDKGSSISLPRLRNSPIRRSSRGNLLTSF